MITKGLSKFNLEKPISILFYILIAYLIYKLIYKVYIDFSGPINQGSINGS